MYRNLAVILLVTATALLRPSLLSASAYDTYRAADSLIAQQKYIEAASLLEVIAPSLPTVLRAAAYSDLGVCYRNLGMYTKADTMYTRAIELNDSGTSSDKIRLNYSNCLIETGDYDKAIKVLDAINSPSLQTSRLINLSHAGYLYRHDTDAAIALLDSCLDIDGIDDGIRAVAIQNKGYYCLEDGNYALALKFLNEALTMMSESDEYYRTLGNIALANARNGDCPLAVKQIGQSMKWFRRHPGPDYRIALRKAAEISLLCGRQQSALSLFRDFFRHEKSDVLHNMASMGKLPKINLWLKEKPLLSKCFMLEDRDAEFMFETAMFRRLTSLLAMNDADMLDSLLKVTPAEIRKALHADEAAVEMISYTDIDGDEVYAAVVLPKRGRARFVRLFDTDFVYQPESVGTISVFNAIKRDSPDAKNALYSDSDLGNAVWGPILAAMPSGVRKVYLAPEGIFHFWGIENMPFAERGRYELRRITSTALLTTKVRDTGHRRQTLLLGGMDYSAVPADSAMTTANHEASDLIRSKAGTAGIFKYLPGTRAEVDSIALICRSADVRHKAGEGELKNIFADFETVHIATHGYSLNLGIRRRPEYMSDSVVCDKSLTACGLALTGANILGEIPGMEDGVLSAREICELDLSAVDFVVLSACQTAQGNVTDEGAAGLVRGLKNAGVKTVMATLWSVDDRSTMLFMKEFYRLLNAGCSKHKAYTGAQNYLKNYSQRTPYRKFSVATLSAGNETHYYTTKYDAPYFWAPFIIIDDF